MAFGWASEGRDLAAIDLAQIEARYRAWGQQTIYYNADIHRAAFATPNYLRPGGPGAGDKAES